MKRFLSSLATQVLLVGFLLPCLAMEPGGSHAHAAFSVSSQEASHPDVGSPHSSSSPSSHDHGGGGESCCCDNIIGAFYGGASSGKTILADVALTKAQAKLLLSFLSAYQLTVDSNEQPDRLRAVFLSPQILTPSLYLLSTSLLL